MLSGDSIHPRIRPGHAGLFAVARYLVAFFILATIMASTLFPGDASAHTPRFAPGGTTLQTAFAVEDTEKSYALYGSIDASGSPRYYRLDLAKGDRLWLQVFTPLSEGFTPLLAVSGPGIPGGSVNPLAIELPSGDKVLVLGETAREAEYEPFTPGAYYFTGELDIRVTADGVYHAVVFSEEGTGPFGLAVGHKEEFTALDWLTMPAYLLGVYRWEGSSWPRVLAPFLIVLVIGGGLLAAALWRRRGPLFAWLTAMAGLLAIAGAATTLVQAVTAATKTGLVPGLGVTAIFVVAPALVGFLVARVGLGTRDAARWPQRLAALILAAVSLGLFGGLFLGPVLALVAAFGPPYRSRDVARGPVGAAGSTTLRD